MEDGVNGFFDEITKEVCSQMRCNIRKKKYLWK